MRLSIECRRAFLSLLVFGVVAIVGCGGVSNRAFSPTYPDNQSAALALVLDRLKAQPPSEGGSVVVGLDVDGQLFAADPAAATIRWKVPVGEASAAPQIAGDQVVFSEGGEVVIRSLKDGSERLRRRLGEMDWIGAGGQGELVAWVARRGDRLEARSRLVVARGDSIELDMQVDRPLGIPTVAGGMVIVPWSGQNISVIDIEKGDEIARLRAIDGMIDRAQILGADVYVGQRGLYRLSASMLAGRKAEAEYFEHRRKGLPGNASLGPDAYRRPPPAAAATHRIRASWRPMVQDGAVQPADETVYLTFYRLVFGLPTEGEGVRWAYVHGRDIVGSAVVAGGMWAIDQEGTLLFFTPDGQVRTVGSLGTRVRVAALRASEAPAEEADPSDGGETATPRAKRGRANEERDGELALAKALKAVVALPDARLVAGRVFAAQLLAGLEVEEATVALLEICGAKRMPPDVRRATCDVLSTRTNGVEHLRKALGNHASFLDEVGVPPVGALAAAVAQQRDKKSLPALLEHLDDPATPVTDLQELGRAIASIGGTKAYEPLMSFLRLYHADGDDPAMTAALVTFGELVIALKEKDGRKALSELVADAHTSAALREKLSKVLAASSEAAGSAK